MKIAFVSTEKLPVPAVKGGAVQIYVDGVLPYLSKHNEITVFSGAGSGLPGEEMKGNVRYIRIPGAKPGQYINVVNSRLNEGFDLVHIFNRPLWLLYLSQCRPRQVYSLSLHNDMFHPDKITRSEALECVARVKFITSVSNYTADRAIAWCPAVRNKIHVIYSGVDVRRYSPDSGKIIHSPESSAVLGGLPELAEDRYLSAIGSSVQEAPREKKIVLFVGRLTPDKGVHVLMRAMKEIMDERDDVILVISGSKRLGVNDDDKYTRLLKSFTGELKGRVIFTGFLRPNELINYYRAADIFVCPSQWNEPLARVIYEAMASGLPVVATDRGGNAEVVSNNDNGILVKDYSNFNAIADAIRLLLAEPMMAKRMGKAGRELVMTNHSWDRVAKDIMRIINE
jgi:spore coat protein SA